MNWQNFTQWCDSLDTDEVAVTPMLANFPKFPEKRLKGYVNPSGEPTVAVSHLKTVAERYGDGDGDGHGGPSQSSDDEHMGIAHSTTVPADNREYEGEMIVEVDNDDIVDKIKKIGERYERETTE